MPKKLFFLGAQNNRCEHFSTCVTNHSTRKIFSTDMQKPLWLLSASFDHIWQQEFFISRNQFLFPSDYWDYYKVDQNSQWELLKLVSVETEERGASYFLSFVHTSYMAPAWLFHPFFKFPPMRTKSDLEPTQLDEGGAWDKKGDVQNPMMSRFYIFVFSPSAISHKRIPT